MAFTETGTFNINDGRNANKNYLLSSDSQSDGLCTKPRQPALNEIFNLPYSSHVKKHDTRLLIGRIAFLTCGKSDTRHLIGLHRFANENLLCGFSVCKSQYVYNIYYMASSLGGEDEPIPVLWLATRAGKIALSCPIWITGSVPQEKICSWSHIVNPLLTKVVRSR